MSLTHQKLSTDLHGNVIFDVDKETITLDFLIDPIASVVVERIEHDLIEAS